MNGLINGAGIKYVTYVAGFGDSMDVHVLELG
jgi:hypothetical protein